MDQQGQERMSQPKFKFGDKVQWKPGVVIEVTQIKQTGNTFIYKRNDGPNTWFEESELELYQEPQKKKLYAYKEWQQWHLGGSECANGHIVFHVADVDYPSLGRAKRAPEHDIEYSEAKSKNVEA
jgi:hypothetical protein